MILYIDRLFGRWMGSVDELLKQINRNPKNVRFTDLHKICDYYFGNPREKGSHVIYKMPWQGDPRINVQDKNGIAKPYQVRQVIKAIEKLGTKNGY
jgi:predicted RNA binding protein YcfA (HicA-like mRNA interferase family)